MDKESYVCDLPLQNEQTNSLVGVVVQYDNKHHSFHCGLAFRMDEGFKILHLAHHNDLECDNDCRGFHVFVIPNLPIELQKAFIPMCRMIKEDIEDGHTDVAYGLCYDEFASYRDGKLMLAGNEIGLTCATYVITLFHSVGIDLVNIHNWPARDEDKRWFEWVKSLFGKAWVKLHVNMTKDHQAKILNEQVGPRFRPEEVAVSSALYDKGPAETQLIWDHGDRLNKYMKCSF